MRATIPTTLDLPQPWRADVAASTRREARFEVVGSQASYPVRIERAISGRLADTYPAGAHDIELQVGEDVPAELLAAITDALVTADPFCRRVVLAQNPDDSAAYERGIEAGYRPGVEVDLREETLSLLVYEPAWVTVTDMDLDRVPTD